MDCLCLWTVRTKSLYCSFHTVCVVTFKWSYAIWPLCSTIRLTNGVTLCCCHGAATVCNHLKITCIISTFRNIILFGAQSQLIWPRDVKNSLDLNHIWPTWSVSNRGANKVLVLPPFLVFGLYLPKLRRQGAKIWTNSGLIIFNGARRFNNSSQRFSWWNWKQKTAL